ILLFPGMRGQPWNARAALSVPERPGSAGSPTCHTLGRCGVSQLDGIDAEVVTGDSRLGKRSREQVVDALAGGPATDVLPTRYQSPRHEHTACETDRQPTVRHHPSRTRRP